MRARNRKAQRRAAREAAGGKTQLAWVEKPVPATHPRLYLGYGSNMDVLQMQRRCVDAMPVGRGLLHDHELVFAGVLTVEPKKGASVPVAIWRVSLADIAKLDRYEGYPRNYGKRYIHVTLDGERQVAFYYYLAHSYGVAPPWPGYYQTCRTGYADFRLDPAPLNEALDRAREAERERMAQYAASALVDTDDGAENLDDWYGDPHPKTCQVCGADDVDMAPFELDDLDVCRDCATVLGLYQGDQNAWLAKLAR